MNLQIFDPKIKKNREVNIEDLIKVFKEHLFSNSFVPVTFDEERIKGRIKNLSKYSSGELLNCVCCIKDLISNTDGFVSGGSEFLKNYKPPYNSSVYKALKNAGVVNVANTSLDEFGLGGSGLESYVGIIPNPLNPEYIVGGSSSGSAYLVSKGIAEFSVVSDTGDSARYPASNCNIFGFKPSFGTISRYGFYPFCSGFDSPSIMSYSLKKVSEVFSVISFKDPRDLCTNGTVKKDYAQCLSKKIDKKLKIAVIRDTFWRKGQRPKESFLIEKEFDKLLEKIRDELGLQVEIYDFPQEILRLSNLVYMVISYSESISNYSNLTGLLFPFTEENGKINFLNKDAGNNYFETLKKNRCVFGDEFVFRQIMGMHFLEGENYENIYIKSKKYLSMINEEAESLFKNYDLIISPSSDCVPPKIKEYKRSYSPSNVKNIMLLANFCSLPAISIPWIFINDMPIGLHLMSAFREDELLLNVSNHIFNMLNKKKNS